jgi:hypothetical protein
LSRLFQAQVNWFSKNSLCKANSAMDKQNIVILKSVHNFLDNSKVAYNDNKSFFRFAHLNFILEVLVTFTDDYEIESIQKNKNTNIVYFNATIKKWKDCLQT